MAKPIAPTPPLGGQAAIDFITDISHKSKASAEERQKVCAGAERIKSMLTFVF